MTTQSSNGSVRVSIDHWIGFDLDILGGCEGERKKIDEVVRNSSAREDAIVIKLSWPLLHLLILNAPSVNRLSFTFIFLLILSKSLCQVELSGKVLSQETKEPIPYANIGISHANVGTISNPDGSFSIRIPQSLINDTLFFSSLGFGKKVVPVQLLYKQPNQIIYLWEKAILLNEVSIRGKRTANKFFELGNSSVKGGVLECDTLYAGRSISLLIENNKPKLNFKFPVYVVKASLRIYRNNLKSFKFRVRFNEVDSLTGQPGEDMLQQSIVMISSMRNGWLEFDLAHLNFIVSKPFFVTFEQITDRSDRVAIADGYRKFLKEHPDKVKIDTVVFEGKKEVRQRFKGSGIDLPGTFVAIAPLSARYTSYVRETSFGKWNKVRGIVTAMVSFSDQPSSVK